MLTISSQKTSTKIFYLNVSILGTGPAERQQSREKYENILKRFFKAGVTPDLAQNSEVAETLAGKFTGMR